MTHSNVTVKTEAALALYKFGEAAGLEALISWLSSEERLAQRAASALANINDPRAVEALRSARSSHRSTPATSHSGSYSAEANREIDRIIAQTISARTSAASSPSRGCAVAIGVVALIVVIWVIATMKGNRVAAPQQSAPQQGQTVGTMTSVKATQLNMRSGPGNKYPVVKVFSQNERIVSIGEPQNVNRELWIQAATPDGQTRGWVSRKLLKP